MKEIKNIIFDFGGVLYDIDVQKTINKFKELGIDDSAGLDNLYKLLFEIEIGKIEEDEFLLKLQALSKNNSSKDDLLEAFNEILIGIQDYKVKDLIKLSNNYHLYLLSNTNIIHYKVFSEQIKTNKNTFLFYELFDKEYYSFELGLRKPDPEIFNFVIKDSKLIAQHTIFVDDDEKNIIAAKELNLQTFWFKDKDCWKELMELLRNNYKA
jgi:glucose-1-phosphatase